MHKDAIQTLLYGSKVIKSHVDRRILYIMDSKILRDLANARYSLRWTLVLIARLNSVVQTRSSSMTSSFTSRADEQNWWRTDTPRQSMEFPSCASMPGTLLILSPTQAILTACPFQAACNVRNTSHSWQHPSPALPFNVERYIWMRVLL